MSLSEYGKVYLVGAGCGSYDLITLRGKAVLERCDVVVYDSLIDNRLLNFVPDTAEKICVGKRKGAHSEEQEKINEILVEKAKCGFNVVRLKGGDPFVFGRGGEEILELQKQGIAYSVVPGITSAVAVPELAGIPVTHRKISRSFHVITGHTADKDLSDNMPKYAALDGTLVFLMGLTKLNEIADSLMRYGKNENTSAAVISNGAGVCQRIVRSTLKDIADEVLKEKLEPPAVIVIGETVGFDFLQTESLPLYGTSVSVTGTKNFTEKLADKLEPLGAYVNVMDYLRVIEYTDTTEFDEAIHNFSKYNWVVLTSVNGAELFLKRLSKLKFDVRKLCGIKIAVIGSGTAQALEKRGIYPELLPESFTSAALGEKLSENVRKGEQVLILRAEKGSRELTNILSEHGISYDDIKIYDVCCDKHNGFEVSTDFITFASASGVDAFFESGYSISSKTKVICIGDITARSLQKYGSGNFGVSKTSCIDGITEMILSEVYNAKIQTTEVK